jgi:hypothetical protein
MTFPNPPVDPTVNEEHSQGGKTWEWDGEKWNLKFNEQTIFTEEVNLKRDKSFIERLYQDTLETAIKPIIPNQESTNIALTEIIRNLDDGGATVIIQDTPPYYEDPYTGDPYGEFPDTGDLWVDSTNFDLYVWEGDAWVELGNSSQIANVIMSDTAPPNPEAGYLWFDTVSANLYVYTGAEWIETGAAGRISPSVYGSGGGDVDLTGYATEHYVDTEITTLENKISIVDTDQQQQINQNLIDIAGLQATDFATEEYVDTIADTQNGQISDLADDVAALKAGAGGSDGPDLTGYATKSYVDTQDATLRADIDKKIEDPTTENKQYVRKKGGWVELTTAINSDTIPANPVRGQIYLTKGNEIVIGI